MESTTVQMAKRGVITIPQPIRESYGMQPGDIFTLLDLGGVLVLSPRRSEVDVLAERMRAQWTEEGETLESMLQALREEQGPLEEVIGALHNFGENLGEIATSPLGKGSDWLRVSTICLATGVTCTGSRFWSRRVSMAPSLAVAPPRLGMEPCPARPAARSRIHAIPFSAVWTR